MKSLRFLSFFVVSLLFSCEKDWLKDCVEGNVQHVDAENLRLESGRICILQNVDDGKKEVTVRIDNAEDFEKYLYCGLLEPSFEPDFVESFILAGKFSHHQCAALERQSLFICNGKLVYQVNIDQHDCQALTTVYYGVLVPRDYMDLQVVFDVQFRTSE
jgi:hypothetical protein